MRFDAGDFLRAIGDSSKKVTDAKRGGDEPREVTDRHEATGKLRRASPRDSPQTGASAQRDVYGEPKTRVMLRVGAVIPRVAIERL
jgi:hypothetical protein